MQSFCQDKQRLLPSFIVYSLQRPRPQLTGLIAVQKRDGQIVYNVDPRRLPADVQQMVQRISQFAPRTPVPAMQLRPCADYVGIPPAGIAPSPPPEACDPCSSPMVE